MAIKILLDECVSPRLAGVVNARGLEATHVNFLGLRSQPDTALVPVIVGGNYTFVTNNRVGFVPLFKYVELHAGLLVIVPAVDFPEQRRLLELALDAIAASGGDATNELVEVFADGSVKLSRWPFDGENS